MKAIKTIKYVIGSLTAVAMAGLALPAQAFAASGSWGPSDIIQGDSLDPTQIDANVISEWVRTFTTWIVGIAIVLFVLRIVITAVDRMLFGDPSGGGSSGGGMQPRSNGGGGGSSDSFLRSDNMPIIIRAYDKPWKDIFKTFALQLAVCACAWLIVNILAGVILWASSSLLNA